MRVVALGVCIVVRPGIDPSQNGDLLLVQKVVAVRHVSSQSERTARTNPWSMFRV